MSEKSKVKTAEFLYSLSIDKIKSSDGSMWISEYSTIKAMQEYAQSHITKLGAELSQKESYIMDSGANYLKSTDELFDRIKALEARNKDLEEALTTVKLYLSTKTVEGFEAYTIAEQALKQK